MSRGLGGLQRRILFVLEGAGEGLLPSEIRRELGSPDRSNTRRAVRGLIARGLVEEDHGRLTLTFWGGVRAGFLKEPYYEVPDPLEEEREWRRGLDAAMAVVRAKNEERRRVHREIEDLWDQFVYPFERRSSWGSNQLRVIAVLVRYAEDPQLGLPKGAVWRIVQGPCERANMLRAVRTLTRRGVLQQSKDGKRLRIAHWQAASLLWYYIPDVVEPPLDDAKALAILESFGEHAGSVA